MERDREIASKEEEKSESGRRGDRKRESESHLSPTPIPLSQLALLAGLQDSHAGWMIFPMNSMNSSKPKYDRTNPKRLQLHYRFWEIAEATLH